jgi:hypothetical protein
MTRVFKANINLQHRINEINRKGAGNFPTPKVEKRRNIRANTVKR